MGTPAVEPLHRGSALWHALLDGPRVGWAPGELHRAQLRFHRPPHRRGELRVRAGAAISAALTPTPLARGLRPLERAFHPLMANPDLDVLFAARSEAVTRIERLRIAPRIEANTLEARVARNIHQAREHRAAHAAAAPRGDHRHATDACIAEEPSATDRPAVSVERQGMPAYGIVLVELQLERHLLLDDEHLDAQSFKSRTLGLPTHDAHGERLRAV